jgi:predicted nucleic acid-binding protein
LALAWPETLSAAAARLFAAARKRWVQLIAPDFWLLECANACWKKGQRRLSTPEESLHAYRVISRLPVTRMDTAPLNDVIIALAIERQITTYDALYVATAEFADVPLVTADARLVTTLRAANWPGRVEHLSEW